MRTVRDRQPREVGLVCELTAELLTRVLARFVVEVFIATNQSNICLHPPHHAHREALSSGAFKC